MMELFPHKTEEQQGMDSKPCASYQGNCQEVDDISCRTVLPAVQVSNVRRVTTVRDWSEKVHVLTSNMKLIFRFYSLSRSFTQQGER
jgi:hypothetical protein